MLRSLFGIAPSHALATVAREPRRKDRRCRLDSLPRLESLEARALLATVNVHLTNFAFTPSSRRHESTSATRSTGSTTKAFTARLRWRGAWNRGIPAS